MRAIFGMVINTKVAIDFQNYYNLNTLLPHTRVPFKIIPLMMMMKAAKYSSKGFVMKTGFYRTKYN